MGDHLFCICLPHVWRRPVQVRKIDANHDGTLDMSEFLTTMIDWSDVIRSGDGTVWQAAVRLLDGARECY